MEYHVEEFGRQLKAALEGMSGELAAMRRRKVDIESELRRLAAAVAEGGHSAFLLGAIDERESELRAIRERLLSEGLGSVEEHLAGIRAFVTRRLMDLRGLLVGETARARAGLAKHVRQITMTPGQEGGKRCYIATGEWNLLGDKSLQDVRVRMVAGARNVFNTPSVPFEFELAAG